MVITYLAPFTTNSLKRSRLLLLTHQRGSRERNGENLIRVDSSHFHSMSGAGMMSNQMHLWELQVTHESHPDINVVSGARGIIGWVI